MIYLTEHKVTKWEGVRIESNSIERARTVVALLFPEYEIIGELKLEIKYHDKETN